MKKKLAFVLDSTSELPDFLKFHPDIYIIPNVIIFGDEVFRDKVELTIEEFYDKLKVNSSIPTTSQPALGEFIEIYEKLKIEYENIIAIHVSSSLSGTFSTSIQASKIANASVHFVDSKFLSIPIGIMVSRAMNMYEKGLPINEIIEQLEILCNSIENYIIIGNLEQLRRSGRMSNAQYFIGNLLSITPIISVVDGKLETFDKVRTHKKAISKILEQLSKAQEIKKLKEIYIINGNCPDKAFDLEMKIKELFPNISVLHAPIGAAIGVHAGEGTLGLVWFK